MLDRLLKHYDASTYVIQLKARFLLNLFLTLLVFIPITLAYMGYLNLTNPATGYSVEIQIMIPAFTVFLAVIMSIILLIRGHFVLSAQLLILFAFSGIWLVMFLDRSPVLSRLDTICMTIAFLSATPIFISRKKSLILIYAALNVIVMYLFIYFITIRLNETARTFADYLADNTIAILFTAVVSYNLLAINHRALDRSERINAELKKSNEGYQAAMEELTAANEEFEAQNDELARSAETKNILIKEIHHRVKNNMQIISSLLNMQIDAIEDPAANQALKDAIGRIHSIASIHERIYRSDNFSRVDMAAYIEELSDDLLSIYSSGDKIITFNHRLSKVFLDINLAIPCGLLINEILTNSIKHACVDHEECRIDIGIEESGGTATLVIEDYGPGFHPELLQSDRKTSMGMQIIDALTRQIGATVDLCMENGARFLIRFPSKE